MEVTQFRASRFAPQWARTYLVSPPTPTRQLRTDIWRAVRFVSLGVTLSLGLWVVGALACVFQDLENSTQLSYIGGQGVVSVVATHVSFLLLFVSFHKEFLCRIHRISSSEPQRVSLSDTRENFIVGSTKNAFVDVCTIQQRTFLWEVAEFDKESLCRNSLC